MVIRVGKDVIMTVDYIDPMPKKPSNATIHGVLVESKKSQLVA